MKTNMTYHAREERINRLNALIDYLGVGEVILSAPDTLHSDSIRCITSTGIIVIKAPNGTIITAYMATVDQAMAMFAYMGFKKIPYTLYRTIIYNNKRYAFIHEIKN